MDTARLVPYEGNPRHNLRAIDKVAASISEFGWRQPIVVGPDMVIIAGHTRHMAALRLGIKQVPVHVARGLSAEQIKAFRLADNRTAEESKWDKDLLALELGALRDAEYDVALTGFSAEEVYKLMTEAADGAPGSHKDPDAAPALPAVPRTRPRDVWILGDHRLRCGDARRLEDVRAATDNRLADIIWTDPPPYNVGYTGGKSTKGKPRKRIENDQLKSDDFVEFLLATMRTLFKMVRDGAPIYVAHSDTEGLAFRSAFVTAGFKLSGCLIWRKDSMVMGRSDYHWQHEPILYGWKEGAPHSWYGGRKDVTFRSLEDSLPIAQMADGSWQITAGNTILVIRGEATLEEYLPSVIQASRPTRSGVHPTMKPTALIERMLKNSAKVGDLVLDVFGGSGSTLLAAERLGMRAALVEIDPAYCDVIVDRWQEYTGKKAHREGEAKPAAPSPARPKKKISPGKTTPAAPAPDAGLPADAGLSEGLLGPQPPAAQ